MDPVTSALFVAANFAVSAFKNREVAKASRTQIQLEVAQAKLQAEEQAFEATKQYREYISFNAALSSMGFGGKTGFTNIASESAANLNKDLQSAAKQQRYIDISGKLALSGVTATKFTSNVQAGISAGLLYGDIADKKPRAQSETKATAKKGLGGK